MFKQPEWSVEDDEVLAGLVEGFHRTKRGSYDLLYLALRACGLAARNDGGTNGRTDL